MVRPDDEDEPFRLRWITFIRALLVSPSVKGVARVAADHADYYDGSGVYPGNGRTARVTGYTPRAVAEAWRIMRALDMAERVSYGSREGRTDRYNLVIPDDWQALPLLAPNEGSFTCQFCDKAFDPSANALVIRDTGRPAWRVAEMVFCPAPQRRKKGPVPPSCFQQWQQKRQRNGNRLWDDLGGDVWKMFRQARGGDW